MIARSAGAGRRHRLVQLLLAAALVVAGIVVPANAANAYGPFKGTVDSSSSATAWASFSVDVTQESTQTITLDWDNAGASLIVGLKNPNGTWAKWVTTGKPKKLTWDYVEDVSGTALNGTVAPAFDHVVGGSGRADMYPSGLDVDPNGVVYIADTGNDGAQAISANGTVLWKHLNWGRANGQFAEPRDVAYLNGKVYVADTGNNRIQVLNASTGAWVATWPLRYGAIMGISAGVDAAGSPVILGTDGQISADVVYVHDPSTGKVLRTIGSGFGTGNGQMNEPRDAATDSSGNVYVADFRNHRIAEFSASGAWLGSFGSLGTANYQFNGPYGIDIDGGNNIYVTDANNSRIQKFSHSWGYLATYGSAGTGTGQFFQLRRAVVGSGSSPRVYGADLWADKVVEFNADTTVATKLGGVTAPVGGFNKPYGVSVTADGTTYVADTTNQRGQVFNQSGGYLRSWGSRGFGDTVGGMNWPHALAYDSSSNTVWVADTKNNRLVQYTTAGAETGHRIGTLGTRNLQFHWPWAITTFGNGDLLVADTWNSRVVRITPGSNGTADVVDWTATGLNYPKGATVSRGVVYVADTLNKRIVELNAADGSVIKTITNSNLHDPEGIDVTPSGDIWVTDSSWNRLLDLAADGTLRQTYGSKGTGNGKFNVPEDVHVKQIGATLYLYVADTGNDRVQVFRIV